MRFFIASLFLLVLSSNFAQDKKAYHLYFGMTASSLSGTGTGISKVGLTGGLAYSFFNNPTFGGEFALEFAQKGTLDPPDHENNKYSLYRLTQNYVQAPVSFLYHRSGVTYFGGLSLGYLFAYTEENENGTFTSISNMPFRKMELAAHIGAKLNFNEHFKLRVMLQNSIVPVRPYPVPSFVWYNRGHYNTMLSFTLVYTFSKVN